MLDLLYEHIDEVVALALFGIGFTQLLLNKHLIKKIIGFSMYVNPLPAGLVLTGIVVSVSVTGIMLGLTIRLYRRYRTLDIDEIAELVRKEGK